MGPEALQKKLEEDSEIYKKLQRGMRFNSNIVQLFMFNNIYYL